MDRFQEAFGEGVRMASIVQCHLAPSSIAFRVDGVHGMPASEIASLPFMPIVKLTPLVV